jgi:Flp pilus assembly protein TadD
LTALLLVFWPSTKSNSDFSQEFLQGRLKSSAKEKKFVPKEGSLEYEWLTSNTQENDPCAQDSRHYELYLKTEYELSSNRSLKAASVSKILIDSNPPLPAHVARARLLFEEGKFFELIQLPFFSQINKSADWETVLMGAKAYEMVGMFSKAEQLFEQAMESHADKDQVVYHRIMHAIKRGQNQLALKIIDDFLKASNPKGRHSIFYQLKAAIKLQEDNPDLDAALAAVSKSIELNPRSEKGLKMKIIILEQLKKKAQPVNQQDLVRTYKQTCALTDDLSLKKALIDKLFKLGFFKQAYQELETLNESTTEHFFDLALLAFRAGNLELALLQVQKSLVKDKNFLKGLMLKLEILSAQKSSAALEFALNWFEGKVHRPIARKALLHLLKNDQQNMKILSLLEDDYLAHPDELEGLAAFADASFLIGNFEQAAKLYKTLERKLTPEFGSIGLKVRLIYSYCATAYLAGQNDLSLTQLERIIPLGKAMPEIYNLAAILKISSGQAKHLDQAVTLAVKAVRAAPTNVHFLDTLSAALVNKGKLIQALRINFATQVLDSLGLTRCSKFATVRLGFSL